MLPNLISAFFSAQSKHAFLSHFHHFAHSPSSTQHNEVVVVKEMPPPLPPLHNHYYLLRHGQSTANVAGIISSARSLAYSSKHGLTDLGYQQAKKAASALVDRVQKIVSSSRTSETTSEPHQLIFISSPFARAHQTAEACLEELLADSTLQTRLRKPLGLVVSGDIVLEDELVERYFGRLDGDPLFTYAYVWPVDRLNVTHTAFGVESVAAVCTRFHSLVQKLEERYKDAHLVLVSHADVLQIAQLYAAGADNVGTFSSYRFENGEVRAMRRTVDSLPSAVPLAPLQRGTGRR
jgi:broad specificity phosphatase PhoE